MSKHADRGKQFNEEICNSVARLRRDNHKQCWDHGFDNVGHFLGPKRPADRLMCFYGTAWLLENKECHGTSIDFSAVLEHQEKALDAICRSGCRGLILVKYITPKIGRVFAWTWYQWQAMKAEIGRKSIPLTDKERPPTMELERLVEGKDRVTWGLQALCDLINEYEANWPDLWSAYQK